MIENFDSFQYQEVEFLHEIGKLLSAAPLPQILGRVVRSVSDFLKCDSCLIYILDGRELILRASKNPHADSVNRLKIKVGEGITGWVVQHKKHVAIAREAYQDSRFQSFSELPEDRFEAFLSVPLVCRGQIVGVINVQHRQPHFHSRRDVHLVSVIGYLVGAEIELARVESENWKYAKELRTHK
jgi:two-component system, response regulator PdtaR